MALGSAVLVPLASPATAPWLGRLAGHLAAADGGRVICVTVLTPDADAERVVQAQAAVDAASAAAVGVGAAATGHVVRAMRVPNGVLDAIDEHDATLALMGWVGESSRHNVFGELIDSIMGRSRIPLAVVRPSATPINRLVVALGDEHLTRAGRRGVDLATQLSARLRASTERPLVAVRGGTREHELPEDLVSLLSATLRGGEDLPATLGHVTRDGDLIVVPVAPTSEGLREATTHVAWATPHCWQMVAIDVGPPTQVDVVASVKDAGMVVEPPSAASSEVDEDTPHVVELSLSVPGDPEVAWTKVEVAARLVGTVMSHRVEPDEDGGHLLTGNVEVMAPSPAVALGAIMVEMDEVRFLTEATMLHYRLV